MRSSMMPPPSLDDFEDESDRTPVGGRDEDAIVVDVAVGTPVVGHPTVGRVPRSTVGRGTIVGSAIPSRASAASSHVDSRARYLDRAMRSPRAAWRSSLALSLLAAWYPDEARLDAAEPDAWDPLDTSGSS
jgi:hypothetical protein